MPQVQRWGHAKIFLIYRRKFHFGTENENARRYQSNLTKPAIFSEMSTQIETAEVEEDDIVILSHDERNSPPPKKAKKEETVGLKRKRSDEDQESDFNFSDTSSTLSKSVKVASTNRYFFTFKQ